MDIYFEMAKHPVFTIEDVNLFYNNMNSARSAVKRMIATSKVLKIRSNLYTCISAENGGPVANRFQIASAISDTSYISHHTAMEYYGVSDQVFYDVYVSSKTKFRNFEFDGYTYHYVKPNLDEGVEMPAFRMDSGDPNEAYRLFKQLGNYPADRWQEKNQEKRSERLR